MVKVKETGLTLASSAYEAIRQDIMEGHIAPGEKLQFDALRERYDVGISPIREALSRLHSDGWVEREEKSGYRVTAISRDELLDAVRTRTLIEGVAIDEAMRHGGTLAEETLVLAYHRLSKERRLTAEHRAILDAYVAADGDEVKRLLAAHYQVTVDIIVAAQFSQL